VARRGLVLLAVWVLFFADLFVGAGLLMSSKAAARSVGLAMLLAAGLALVGLTLWFYVQNRRGVPP